ncbi:MAG: glycosyltransferase [Oscillospiraceae bacterium]|nr:glycosyltransferase [Oscillospiraceae bacterium]
MRVLQINSYNFGSTGNIMVGIAETARRYGMECTTACPEGKSMRVRQLDDHLFIGSRVGRNMHIKFAEFTGLNGCLSILDTFIFLRKVKKLNPDIIHLHNLHNCYINLPMLFGFLRKSSIPVVWTLHDCWAFTGKCPYFEMAGCDRWENGCHDCMQLFRYPAAKTDKTAKMWQLKRKWFTSIDNATIVTPSEWLGNLVKKSFLGCHDVKVIPNGTDLNVFVPTESDFRKKHGIDGKFMLLGVAFDWDERKGIDVFEKLADILDERFAIVLVGVDEKSASKLPENIITVSRTQNRKELAEIYTAADIFVNPTREETLGMVNIEALACGTPVLTYRTGGSPEPLDDTCGCVVEKDDVNALIREIVRICEEKPFDIDSCRKASEKYDKQERFAQYCRLYEEKYGK